MPPAKTRKSANKKRKYSSASKSPKKSSPLKPTSKKTSEPPEGSKLPCLCIICGQTVSIPSSKNVTKLTHDSINSLCTLLNLAEFPDAKGFFSQFDSYCKRCEQIVSHVESLFKMIKTEREHISGLLLETYGQIQLGNMFLKSPTSNRRQSGRERSNSLGTKYPEFFIDSQNDDIEADDDENYEPGNESLTHVKVKVKAEKIDVVAGIDNESTATGAEAEVLDYSSFLENFQDPICVYDDELEEYDGDGDTNEQYQESIGIEEGSEDPDASTGTMVSTKPKRGTLGPFKCPECPSRASRKDHLRRHLLRMHPQSTFLKQADIKRKLDAYKCSICPAILQDRFHLKRHYAKVHPEDGLKSLIFACDKCEKTYDNRQELRFHKKIHDPNIANICHFCNFGYSKGDRFKRHMVKFHSPNYDFVDV